MLAAAVAEAEFELGDGGRVLLRPSGTEPLVRVMVEAGTADQAAGRRRAARRASYASGSACADRSTLFRLRAPAAASLRLVRRGHPGDRPPRRGPGPPALGDRPGRRGGAAPTTSSPPWETGLADRYQGGRDDLEFVLLGAFDGDAMWGAGRVDLTLLRQPALGLRRVIYTHPDRRRRGIGRALAEASYDVARDRGRRRADDRGLRAARARRPPGLLFGAAMGFTRRIEDGMKVVDLDETEPLWDGLEAQVAPRHAATTAWSPGSDHVPDELSTDYCRAQRDVLRGGADGRARDRARALGRRAGSGSARSATCGTGRRDIAAGAVARRHAWSGSPRSMLNDAAPSAASRAARWSTRSTAATSLGLAIKLANHRQAARALPRVPAAAHRQRRRERADERRQRRARLPRGRALRRDAAGGLTRRGNRLRGPGRLPRLGGCRSDPSTRATRPRWPPGTRRYHAAHVFGLDPPVAVDAGGDARRVPRRADRRAGRALRRVRRRAAGHRRRSSSCRRWTTAPSPASTWPPTRRPRRPRLRHRAAGAPHRGRRRAGRATC